MNKKINQRIKKRIKIKKNIKAFRLFVRHCGLSVLPNEHSAVISLVKTDFEVVCFKTCKALIAYRNDIIRNLLSWTNLRV